jgi:hypothetical protein
MPTMFGVPVSGQPFMTAQSAQQADSGKELAARKAGHKMAVESEIKHDNKMPLNEPGLGEKGSPEPLNKDGERTEAIKQRDEAVKLLELAKSPKDKETASNLVKFWQDRIDQLTREIDGKTDGESSEIRVIPPKVTRVIETPELFGRIKESAVKRVKNPRNKRHKAEKKKSKKVVWLI